MAERFDFSTINPEDYKNLTATRSVWHNDIVKALKITEKFIIKKKLILTGGLAIHNSLVLKGHPGIYTAHNLPDYDCVSPNHQKDAYELATILCLKGIPHVNAIQGLHITTMRTRIFLGVENMDVTYVPPNVFDIISKHALTYKNNLKIIHPHFQMLDQHRSLMLPFENEPMYNLENRWVKDMTRFDLLYTKYPLKAGPIKLVEGLSFDKKFVKNNCISGIMALAYWVNMAKKLKLKTRVSFASMNFKITKNNISCSFPVGIKKDLVVFSDDYKKTLNNCGTVKHFESLLQKMPRRIECQYKKQNITVYDNLGQKISCYFDKEHEICVTNLQLVMLYLLEKYIYYEIFGIAKKDRSLFATLYVWALELVRSAAKEYQKGQEEYKVFLPSPITYGKLNQSINLSFMKDKLLFKLGIGTQVSHFVPKPGYPDMDKNNCIINASFNPNRSNLFSISGNKIEI